MHHSEPGARRLIVALDYAEADAARALVARLDPARCALKIGKELFTRAGPALVREFVAAGYAVFLDLKFHDIPNTVAAACRAAADLGVWMVNVHASGGRRMMEAAVAALADHGPQRPLLIGVTVLTSLQRADLAEIGLDVEPEQQVLRLARLAQAAGLDGVVCAPREAALLRTELGEGFRLVTPGVRPAGSEAGDQRRVMTPAEAVAAGADHLVIGRPITRAPDPLAALDAIEREIRGV